MPTGMGDEESRTPFNEPHADALPRPRRGCNRGRMECREGADSPRPFF
jgi:hypothetical protein